jgi:hypothetical protein
VIAAVAGDEARARAGAGKLVKAERDLERAVHRLGARVAEQDVAEIARRHLGEARGELKARRVPRLKGGHVVEPSGLAADRLDDGSAAMAGIAAPQAGHGVEQSAAVGGVIMHALGAIDQPGAPPKDAIGGEGKPIG